MTFNIIDEWILIFLMFGVYSCLLILLGYWMGKKLPKIQFYKGEPVLQAEDFKPELSKPEDEQDPYDAALNGPVDKEKLIETI